MNYQQVLPTESLRKYVRYFWVLENDSSDNSQRDFKIISDGSPGLIFQETPNAFFDKDNRKLPQQFLYGQTTRHTEQKSTGNFRNIGVYFQPTALKSIFGMDANELTDQHIDLNDLVRTNLAEQLVNTSPLEKQIELLSIFFMQQISLRKAENKKVNFAIAQLQNGESLKSIRTDLNISERSLERYFNQYIGVPPKLYARISRFQFTLENLRNAKFDRLTDIAYQTDYFDQSHFIREFREFAGTSPKRFKLKANEQVANFPEWKT